MKKTSLVSTGRMSSFLTTLALFAAVLLSAPVASAQTTIAQWNFDALTLSTTYTNNPADGYVTNVAADVGSGTASGFHATTTAVYSTPSGNGSTKALSANNWSVGDYWQVVLSTAGYQDISVSFDQIGSSTGPRDFYLAYSTDGVNFTQFGSAYLVTNSPSWSPSTTNTTTSSFSFNLTSVTAINNSSAVYFRLVDNSTTSTSGGSVATSGTGRIDNFLVVAGSTSGGGPVGITTQPTSRTNNAGTTATFTVSGTNVAGYFWLKGGTSISDTNANGKTSATLSITNALAFNAGSFRVVLTNSINSVTSDVVTLTVIDPAINTQPASQTVLLGSAANFSATAGGTATLGYQWRKDGADIAGATDLTYSIPSTIAGDAGSYTIVVTNGLGASTSSIAVLTILVPQTDPLLFSSGNYTQNFNTLATNGTANLWVEDTTLHGWYASRQIGGSFTNYRAGTGSDTAGALYSFGSAASTDRALGSTDSGTPGNIAYGLRFTNDHATLSRSNITISFTGEQWRSANTVTQTLAFSYRISNDAITSSDAEESQVWTPFQALDFNTPNVSSSGAVDGNNAANRVALSATLTNVVVLTNKEVFFRWKDVNDTGNDHGFSIDDLTITSDGVVATIMPPGITTHPQSRTNNYGTTATFTVSANGTAPFTYQWRKNGSPLSDGGNTSGSMNQTLSITAVTDPDEGSYDVIVSNGAGATNSAVAVLTVNDPGFFTQPASRTNVAGDTANFFASAAGTPFLTYQWQRNGIDLADGGNISGATSNALNILNVSTNDQASYTIVVTSGVPNSITSSAATLTILQTPPVLLARWDFNDTNILSASSPAPSVGSGSSALQGGISGSFQSGSFSDADGAPGPLNSAWHTTGYPSQGNSNKTAGVRFNVSTVDYGGIFLTWEARHSNTASKHARLQYTADGVNFVGINPITMATENATGFIIYFADLSGLPGVNNNPNFGFRIVTEFESTAIGTTNANYVGTAGTYGTSGTMRYDVVNVFAGVALKVAQSGNNAVISWLTNFPGYTLQQKATLSAASWSSNGLPATTIVGSNYSVTTPLTTNAYFRLVKTNF